MTHSVSDGARESTGEQVAARPLAWRTNLSLFLVTAASVFWTGLHTGPDNLESLSVLALLRSPAALKCGAQFTVTLLAILVAHEFGHFIAARIHKVDASLPFFIPIPYPISPFGTMGAVIRMRGSIPNRRALLDIGAAGPLAGLAVAIPAYIWGVMHSGWTPITPEAQTLGDSTLTRLLNHFGPSLPPGMDLFLSPVAYAAWIGFFITMINLLPIGQLDGGHIAYALLGPRQNRVSIYVHRSLLAFFCVSLVSFVYPDLRAGFGLVRLGQHVQNSLFWLGLFEFLAVLGTLSSVEPLKAEESLSVRTRLFATVGLWFIAYLGNNSTSPLLWLAWFAGLGMLLTMEIRWGALRPHAIFDHPAIGPKPLDKVRAIIAVITLAMLVLLFMPTPMSL